MKERLEGPTHHGYSRPVFVGNFAMLQEFLLEKESFFWSGLRLFEFLLRGFSQVVCANNPISGLLIVISLACTAPVTLLFTSITGTLGLLLSVLLRDSQDLIANGLTTFNPVLLGAVSCTLIPTIYGPYDTFSILCLLLATIFCAYVTRSLENNKLPYIAWPFNLSELMLILLLYTQDNGFDTTEKPQPLMRMHNATSDATTADVSIIGGNATGVHVNWGMMFRAVIMSASQLMAIENAVTGSVIYLAILLFSPVTAGFALFGAIIGSLAGLMLGVELASIYSGFWGYNAFLTGGVLGGNFFVLTGQTVVATIMAVVYTVIVQYCIHFFFKNLKLPVLGLPFTIVVSLFVNLRKPDDKSFPKPASPSYPEKNRADYKASRLLRRISDRDDNDDDFKDRKQKTVVNV
ncbi:urea transporter 1-like [Ceratina calcarata]|uniref:Urea transporter 1-like n=1 Tax=Ceratina calcarata TaxID=156304 RepID=A0AAJ7JEU0_9HYME|nr:urea transporter 1-like [Ceratina calcarata]